MTHLLLIWTTLLLAPSPATGLQNEVAVQAPTRLDWQFIAAAFGPDAVTLPRTYDSTRQRYQLYVPESYNADRPWPLVVFISPGDDPMGWPSWQGVCEKSGVLFCAAYGAGNNCPPGQRARIVLDMLDDVRRHYRIDPEQTYLSGFSGGGRMACTIGFLLPEYFGGVVPICGTNPLPELTYLRHCVRRRLSIAFVTGSGDFNRKENEDYMAPLFHDLGVRSRLWVVPKLGHAIPSSTVLAEVYAWLAEDLPRRREEVKARPGLAVSPDEAPRGERQAARLLETAEAALRAPDRTWEGVALLQGILARWEATEPGHKARRLLEQTQSDAKRLALVGEQGGREERQSLKAEATALACFGETKHALRAWELLAKGHPQSPEGKQAAAEAARLRQQLAATPYLGVGFAGDAAVVAELAPHGPAERAGLRRGDRVTRWGKTTLRSADDLRRALTAQKPGDKVALEVARDGQPLTVTVELGAVPVEEK